MSSVFFHYDDGGRADAGFKGETGDCVCRAVAIVTGRPYADVYKELHAACKTERRRSKGRRSSPRTGVYKTTLRRFMEAQGGRWVPTMGIGTGCKVHLKRDELPRHGRFILNVSRHVCAYVDGVLRDTADVTRGGTRCVYGYWVFGEGDQ